MFNVTLYFILSARDSQRTPKACIRDLELPFPPYVGLTIAPQDEWQSTKVSRVTWYVAERGFEVEGERCAVSEAELDAKIALYKSQGWKVEDFTKGLSA